jgi:hypothetical protein
MLKYKPQKSIYQQKQELIAELAITAGFLLILLIILLEKII